MAKESPDFLLQTNPPPPSSFLQKRCFHPDTSVVVNLELEGRSLFWIKGLKTHLTRRLKEERLWVKEADSAHVFTGHMCLPYAQIAGADARKQTVGLDLVNASSGHPDPKTDVAVDL